MSTSNITSRSSYRASDQSANPTPRRRSTATSGRSLSQCSSVSGFEWARATYEEAAPRSRADSISSTSSTATTLGSVEYGLEPLDNSEGPTNLTARLKTSRRKVCFQMYGKIVDIAIDSGKPIYTILRNGSTKHGTQQTNCKRFSFGATQSHAFRMVKVGQHMYVTKDVKTGSKRLYNEAVVRESRRRLQEVQEKIDKKRKKVLDNPNYTLLGTVPKLDSWLGVLSAGIVSPSGKKLRPNDDDWGVEPVVIYDLDVKAGDKIYKNTKTGKIEILRTVLTE